MVTATEEDKTISMIRYGQWLYRNNPNRTDLPDFIRQLEGDNRRTVFYNLSNQVENISVGDVASNYDILTPFFESHMVVLLDKPIRHSIKIILEPFIKEEDRVYTENSDNRVYKAYVLDVMPILSYSAWDKNYKYQMAKLMNKDYVIRVDYFGESFRTVLNRYVKPTVYHCGNIMYGYINDTSEFVYNSVLDIDKDTDYLFNKMDEMQKSVSSEKDKETALRHLKQVIYLCLSDLLDCVPVSSKEIKLLESISAYKPSTLNLIRRLVNTVYPNGTDLDPQVLATIRYTPYDFNVDIRKIKNDSKDYNIVTVRSDNGEVGILSFRTSPTLFRDESLTGFDKDELKHILSL